MLQLKSGLRTALAVLTAGFCLILAGQAASKSVYVWETEDGVSSFTDDEKQVPKRYKGAAKRETLRNLQSYERFTPSDGKATGNYAERLRSRLSTLRESSRVEAPAHPGMYRRDGSRAGIQVSGRDRGAVGIALGGRHGGHGPVDVENWRVRVGSEIATRHATVVSQGGKILSVIRDEANVSNISDIPRIRNGRRP